MNLPQSRQSRNGSHDVNAQDSFSRPDLSNVPVGFICPLFKSIMRDPVIDIDGNRYTALTSPSYVTFDEIGVSATSPSVSIPDFSHIDRAQQLLSLISNELRLFPTAMSDGPSKNTWQEAMECHPSAAIHCSRLICDRTGQLCDTSLSTRYFVQSAMN